MYSDAKSKIEPNYEPTMKTVLVLGGAYAGASAVRILSEGLPKDDWRIVLVDRNSHINHVYIFSRLAVLPGHEHKGFVPFNHLLSRPQDVFVQASVRAVHPTHVILDRPFQGDSRVNFDFLVYALGSKLPAPLDLWGSPNPSRVLEPYAGTKQQGIAWLKSHQEVIGNAASVLVVGGGALGIQFATDIAAIHPSKNITLLHSRNRLLPRFNERMHTEILETLLASNVQVVLGERLDMLSVSESKVNERGQRVVKTVNGRQVVADLILLCTGQKPNTHFLSEMDPTCVNPDDGLAHVLRTMQLGVLPTPTPTPIPLSIPSAAQEPTSSPNPDLEEELELELEQALAEIDALSVSSFSSSSSSSSGVSEESPDSNIPNTPYPNIFVVGDSADAFGAIPAGHTAYYQAGVAARNILKMIMWGSGRGRSLEEEEEEVDGEPESMLDENGNEDEDRDSFSSLSSSSSSPSSESLELEPESELNPDLELEHYQPGLPTIKISLGLTKAAYEANGTVGTSNDGVDDLNAAAMWTFWGWSVEERGWEAGF